MRNPVVDPKPLSAIVRFSRWLSRLQHGGIRGFYDSELRAVYGKQYQKVMSDWIARGWIEHRDTNRPNLWWLSKRGTRALESAAEKQQALQESES